MKKILIVVDMQNDFIDGSLGSDRAQAVVEKVINKINKFKGDAVICTMDTHSQDYLKTQEGKNLPVVHCVEGTDGWMINQNVIEALHKLADRNIVYRTERKHTFGAKYLPQVVAGLLGVKDDEQFEIELCGVCTGICVISNAMLLKAFFTEAKVIVDASCCACVSEESHKTALEAMKLCQIRVIGESL